MDLQLVVALVAKNHESYHYKLPVFFKVIKNLKRTRYTRLVKYKEDIDSNLLVVNDKSKTWTARAIQEVVGGEWIVSPPDGWFVKSIVAGVSHIDLVDSPVMFAAHTSFDRARNEQSRIVSVWDNHHLIVKNVSKLAGALVSKEVSGLPAGFPILMVSDPFKAVIELGIANRQRLNCPVVAVTGSAGKTSVTNIINSVIGASRKVYSTYDNYNSRCGIFITLASAPLDSELVVLETAVTAINSINNYHLKLLNPDIGVITNIGPSHMGEGMTLLDVARRKANIVEGINEGGCLIVCRDTLFFDYIEDRANLKKLKILTYGEHPDSDIRLIDYNPKFGEVEVLCFNISLKYKIGAFGKHMAINSLICLALSFLLGLNIEKVLFNMRLSYNSKGRGGFFYSYINNNKVLVFDESYNANPISMKSSLEFFSSYVDNKPGRSILVLGDMLELGEKASEYHADIIPYVLSCKPYRVYLVGDEMHKLLGSMEKEGVAAFAFNSLEEIYNDIVKIVSDEDNIFFKSSNSIGLSKLVERIVKSS